jgi:hypothetical protein
MVALIPLKKGQDNLPGKPAESGWSFAVLIRVLKNNSFLAG